VNKLFDIIFKDLKRDKSMYISLIIVVIISLIFGTLFITILTDTDKALIKTQITDFFESIENRKYVPLLNMKNNILNNNIFAVILWLLGFSIIGIPIIICMLFYKGFTLSFTVSSLIYAFKGEGILVSIFYIFPHLILNIIIYFILTYYSFLLSIKLLKNLINKEQMRLKHYIKKYLFVLVITIVILSISALYETFIIPHIIKLIY